jgi:glutathione S-transferase
MSLIIYGTPQSRTMRTLWVAEELGLSYEHRPLAWDDPALKGPDFLRLNPAGSVPTIVDDGFALAESMAINLYLSKKYGSVGASALYPDGPEDEAQVWRWSLWAQSDLEPWVQRDALWSGAVDRIRVVSAPLIQRALTTLDRALVERAWIATDRFTVGDLNVAGVLSPSRSAHLDLQEYTNVTDWLSRCYDRPAARATRARFSARS